jgi:hypothetical protein
MEFLKDMSHMDSADDPSEWGDEHIKTVIKDMAQFHSIYFGKSEELGNRRWLSDKPTAEKMKDMADLWNGLAFHALQEFPNWYGQDNFTKQLGIIEKIPQWWPEIDKMPKTLIHNDFNLRNICLRKEPKGYRLCAYDWELATIHLPQHDIAEFLIFTQNADTPLDQIEKYVEVHRAALAEASGIAIDKEQWNRGFLLCLYDLLVNRISLYIMAHTYRHYEFMERVFKALSSVIEKYEAKYGKV